MRYSGTQTPVHIPESVSFDTKPELAQRMVERALSAELASCWVVADSVYGHSPDLHLFLEERAMTTRWRFPIEVVCVQTRDGPLAQRCGQHHSAAARQDWQRLSMSQGTKGERLFDWAILPWMQGGSVDGRHWLSPSLP